MIYLGCDENPVNYQYRYLGDSTMSDVGCEDNSGGSQEISVEDSDYKNSEIVGVFYEI